MNKQKRKTKKEKSIFSKLLQKCSRKMKPVSFQLLRKARANTCCAKSSSDFARRVNAGPLVLENLLHGYGVAFHARDFRGGSDAACRVGKPRDLQDHIQSRSYLLAHGALR